jgi:hypothetical protein
MSSTGTQVTFFGGPLLTVFGTHSSPSPYEALLGDLAGCSAQFQGTMATPDHRFSFAAQGDGAEAVMRLVGCLLIWNISARALPEALSDLKAAWEFYGEPGARLAPIPPTLNRLQGRLAAPVQRPELSLPER